MSAGGIIPFEFGGAAVRTVIINGDLWFVAKDVAEVLGYEWNGSVRIKHVPDQWKGVTSVVTPRGEQPMAILSEQGVYFFLGRSDKPTALPMQIWVANEVLPAIRRNGGYMIATPDETPEALALRAMTMLQATVERQQARNAVLEPKTAALDRMATATDGALSITATANVLQVKRKDLSARLDKDRRTYRRTGGSDG